MKPETILKKIREINKFERVKKDYEWWQNTEKLYREAIANFDSYNKVDLFWILDGLWRLVQNYKEMAIIYEKIYDEINQKRYEKWGDYCESTGDEND